jgi:cytochrome d ubiquinol oxidase subunit II
VLTGVLAVLACAYLAATYLCGDAARLGDRAAAEWFRRRSVVVGLACGAVSVAGLLVVARSARELYDGLTGRGLPLVAGSVAAGALSLLLVLTRRYVLARLAAGLAVAALVWGWAVARYPVLLPGLDVPTAAAPGSTLSATVIVSVVGLAVLVPSMGLLFRLFQQPETRPSRSGRG